MFFVLTTRLITLVIDCLNVGRRPAAAGNSSCDCLNWMELWTKDHRTCSWSQGGVLVVQGPWLAISLHCKSLGVVTGMNSCYGINLQRKSASGKVNVLLCSLCQSGQLPRLTLKLAILVS